MREGKNFERFYRPGTDGIKRLDELLPTTERRVECVNRPERLKNVPTRPVCYKNFHYFL